MYKLLSYTKTPVLPKLSGTPPPIQSLEHENFKSGFIFSLWWCGAHGAIFSHVLRDSIVHSIGLSDLVLFKCAQHQLNSLHLSVSRSIGGLFYQKSNRESEHRKLAMTIYENQWKNQHNQSRERIFENQCKSMKISAINKLCPSI